MTMATRNRDYMQLCWVVPDLDAAIAHWVKSAGAGPFFVFEDVHFTDATYRGAPADIPPHRAAIGQSGAMQIELIEPIKNDATPYAEFVKKNGSGIQHMSFGSIADAGGILRV